MHKIGPFQYAFKDIGYEFLGCDDKLTKSAASLIGPVVDSKLDALLHFLFIFLVELSVELLYEDDDVVNFVVLQVFQLGDEVVAQLLVEGRSPVVQFVELGVG